MTKPVFLCSIHDVLTDRQNRSDPTGQDEQVPPISIPPTAKKLIRRTGRQNVDPKTLRLISIHDVLTERQKNSDPTGQDE